MATVDNWLLVKLFLSFQDTNNLYFVMEFCAGGDLMKLLIKEDIFPEDVTRFYMAECARAIAVLHEMDYVHRDLKPDNILIARDGHIKLSDFGLAKASIDTGADTISKWQGEVSKLKSKAREQGMSPSEDGSGSSPARSSSKTKNNNEGKKDSEKKRDLISKFQCLEMIRKKQRERTLTVANVVIFTTTKQ